MKTRKLNMTIELPVGIRTEEEDPELAARIIVAGFNAQVWDMAFERGQIEKITLLVDPLPHDAEWVGEARERPECGSQVSDRVTWVMGVVKGLHMQTTRESEERHGTQED